MAKNFSDKALLQVRAHLQLATVSLSATMIGQAIDRCQEGTRRVLCHLQKIGEVEMARGCSHDGGASVLYHIKGRQLIIPHGCDFRHLKNKPRLNRRRGADCETPHQVVTKDWQQAAFRHPMDVAFFGPAGGAA